MENTDTTLLEMQQQLQQLKDKLNSQKIVNERILRKSCNVTASRLRFKSNVPILFGVAAILMTPSLHVLGVSTPFLIFNVALMLFCIIYTIFTNRHIPSVDSDMVTAAEGSASTRRSMPTGSSSDCRWPSSGSACWSGNHPAR